MEIRRIGILLSGVTGRMGTNQHLVRSIGAIIQQGGVQVRPDLVLMPDPLLIGRNEQKLQTLAVAQGHAATGKPYPFTTDLQGALDGKFGDYEVFFDSSGTLQRGAFIEMAASAGKHIYCEKPIATTTADAIRLAEIVENAGVKNGVVQDKLWLPGFQKIAELKKNRFFGDLLSVHGEFGYWVFTGLDPDQPPQRPSWNYRAEDGGGIIMDMFCHWQYVIDNLFGPIASVLAHGHTDIPQRRDEQGDLYRCTADDSAYALFLLKDGTVCQFNSSWCVRVRRDDLLTVEVHGTQGSAVAGLRDVRIQNTAQTPRPVWNPDIRQPIDFYDSWQQVPDTQEYDNAFKIQWEFFLRHVALDEPFRWTLREGAKGVQLAELALQSWHERKWIDVPEL
jgi:predicted dehydrogenase